MSYSWTCHHARWLHRLDDSAAWCRRCGALVTDECGQGDLGTGIVSTSAHVIYIPIRDGSSVE